MNISGALDVARDVLGVDSVLFVESLLWCTVSCYAISKFAVPNAKIQYYVSIVTTAALFLWCFGILELLNYVVLNFILFFWLKKYRKSIWCPIASTAVVIYILLARYSAKLFIENINSISKSLFASMNFQNHNGP